MTILFILPAIKNRDIINVKQLINKTMFKKDNLIQTLGLIFTGIFTSESNVLSTKSVLSKLLYIFLSKSILNPFSYWSNLDLPYWRPILCFLKIGFLPSQGLFF